MNTVRVERIAWTERTTIGIVRLPALNGDKVCCFSLEHGGRMDVTGRIKPERQGRIPMGTYPLRWETDGESAESLQALGFRGVLEVWEPQEDRRSCIHMGPTRPETPGSIVLGMGANLDGGVPDQLPARCEGVLHQGRGNRRRVEHPAGVAPRAVQVEAVG